MKILYLHAWNSVVGGVKPTHLKSHGHEVVEPALDHDKSGQLSIADHSALFAVPFSDRLQEKVLTQESFSFGARNVRSSLIAL